MVAMMARLCKGTDVLGDALLRCDDTMSTYSLAGMEGVCADTAATRAEMARSLNSMMKDGVDELMPLKEGRRSEVVRSWRTSERIEWGKEGGKARGTTWAGGRVKYTARAMQ